MIASEPLHHFVDDYLSFLYETNPSAATFDGVHLHDDLLENLERGAVEQEAQSLAGLARRLAAISTDSLTGVERVERPWIAAHIQGRLHELEKIRTWERNPQLYGELLGASLAGQALFDFAPAEERARRVLSKLRQTPRFIQSARDNIKDPPGIFVKSGLETLRGTLRFIESDLPRAFADVDDLGLLSDLADAQTEAIDALKSYIAYLETDQGPKARASFRLGADRFAAKLRFEEGLEIPLDRLLEIGLRELGEVQEQFRAAAGAGRAGRPARGLAARQGSPRAAGRDRQRRPRAADAAVDLHRAPRPGDAASRRAGDGGADAGLLPLGVRQHVDAGAVRGAADARVLLPHRRRAADGRRSASRSTCAT